MAKLHKAEVKSPEDIRNWIRAELLERYEHGWQAGYKSGGADARRGVARREKDLVNEACEYAEEGFNRSYERGASDALSAELAKLQTGKPVDVVQILRDLLKTEGLFNG